MLQKIEHYGDKVEHYTDLAYQYGTEYGIKIVGSILIFLIGKWIAGQIVSLIKKGMQKTHVDPTLVSFAANATYVALIVVIVIAAISNLGVETTSFVAVFGAAGLAVGLALKDTLSNVGAAVLIIFFRPFKVGDAIEASGVMGTVKSINLFSTTLTTPDNRSIIIPNGALISGNIINNTGNETRRIDMVFDIDYKDDLKLAKEVIMNVLLANEKVLLEPAPVVAIGALAQNSVQIFARPWVAVDAYADVTFEIIEAVKLEFDKHKLSIPFPQMALHVRKEEL
ncbi:MAG: mechanosensitive ion channel [Sulfuricurvum sp.]|uniref:mechanosensitive ion channel family protein n=1 Tax=Sulfuricurvum sp. TaxID=2025608 RepID=UPI0026382B60|nr:mechanosensitive ion channel domain-containing protein [Sulfuricurvum sp.]MDD5160914.1 mechanosensitive ion channel [Sulfuricurvum sp.]